MRGKMKILLNYYIVILVLFPFGAEAFNWRKCQRTLDSGTAFGNAFNFSTSTSQFISSIGNCAMLGDLEHDKKVFYVHNFDKMKDDFTKGSGEYAVSFAKMHGCNSKTQIEYSRIMKGNFNELMSVESADSPEKTYQYLESFFEYNQTLKVGCITKNKSS